MEVFELNKRTILKVIAGIVIFAIAFSIYLGNNREKLEKDEFAILNDEALSQNSQTTTEAVTQEITKIFVHVAGAVKNPSVIEVAEGTRVFEAIEKAGGVLAEADTKSLNLATKLIDGEKIYVPLLGEALDLQMESNPLNGQGKTTNDLVNINLANSTELQTLNGIGPSTAEKILSYRNENGKFEKIDDLKNVSGIGEKTFDKFKDKISIY